MRAWPLLLILLPRVATADSMDDMIRTTVDAVTPVLASQVRAIGERDAGAFTATFHDEGYAILPIAAGEGRGKATITTAAKAWFASIGKATITALPAKCDALYISNGAVCTTTLAAVAGKTTLHWRLSAVLVPTGDDHARWLVLAEHVSEAIEDRPAIAAAAAGKLPALPVMPAMTKSGNSAVDVELTPDHIGKRAGQVWDSDASTLIGSAAGEVALGKAAVAQRLRGWSSLKLASTAFVFGKADGAMTSVVYVAAHVDATFQSGGKTVKVPYRALAVYFTPPPADPAGTGLVLAHFSIATR